MKKYQAKDILELKEEWKKIAVGAITEETLTAKQAIQYMVIEMADAIINPNQSQTPYVQSLTRKGIRNQTAHKITKEAFALALERQKQLGNAARPLPAISKDQAQSGSVGEKGKKEGGARTAVAAGSEAAGSDPDGLITEYVRKLPATLPKPIRKIPVEYNIKERKKVSLMSLRPDIFDREFERSLRGLAPVTPGNAFGRYDPNPDLDKYPHIWDAVGNYHVPPNILAECLPYMAEEGLLEFHKVPLYAVQELEELRQLYIKKGLIGEYDRNVRPNNRDQVTTDPIDR
jgi:hypothetical protein